MMDPKLVSVALGQAPADRIIRNGKLINVHTGEIYETEIAILGERIASIGPLPQGTCGPNTEIIDAGGMYLAPGFVDAHIHFESSMLTLTEFAKMVVRHGTTAVASDLMEVSIVSGVEGAKEILKESETLPVKLYYPVPSFMEDESELHTTGAVLDAAFIDELLKLPQAVGLAEVLSAPVLAGSPNSARLIALAESLGKTVEGHAPALTDPQSNAVAGAGYTSNHECGTKGEVLAQLRAGINVLMREGSAATDLKECLKAIVEDKVDTRHCSMVSDDIDALHIAKFGHLDHKIRIAIAAGVDPVAAIQMATLNPAESLRVADKCGSIAPGRDADIVFLSDLPSCKVERVISRGRDAVLDGKLAFEAKTPAYSPVLLNTVKIGRAITADDMKLKVDPSAKAAKVHVIGSSPVSLLTQAREAVMKVENGVVLPDADRDLLSIVCVERHGKNGNIGRSFIQGFHLKEGAFALSVGHDHHNITVVGADFEDMAAAVNRIQELQGGAVLVKDGKVLAEIPLPVCGLLSTNDGESVAAELQKMVDLMASLGCEIPSPNVTLSFITLIFIPDFGITDRGLFDVAQFKVIDPVIRLEL